MTKTALKPEERMQDVLARLDEYRIRLGLSYKGVSDHIGVDIAMLSRMINGKYVGEANGVLHRLEAYMSRPPEVISLQNFIDRHNMSRAAVARKLGFSASKLSQVLRGLYPSYTGQLAIDIDQFVWLHETCTEGLGNGNFQNTQNARILFNACHFALNQRSTVIVIGEPGSGKTVIGRRYQHEHINAIFVDTYSDMPRSALLQKIYKHLFRTRKNDTFDAVFELLVSRLRGMARLLIIDEANQLSVPALHIARNLADQAGIGLVLMGTDLLWGKLHDVDPTRNGEFAQVFTRAVRYRLVKASRSDSDMLVKDFLEDASEAVLKAFYIYGNKNLRTIVKLVGLSHDLAKANGGKITPAIIEEASKMLIFGAEDIARSRTRKSS